ncbi:hypothetical protein K6L09_38120 [Burkholderia cepacia]
MKQQSNNLPKNNRCDGNLTKLEFAQRLVDVFPGFRKDDDVSGADLVDWMNEHLDEIKQVKGLLKDIRAIFPAFGKEGDVDGGDLVAWVNETFADQFPNTVLSPRLFEGNWNHLFGPGRAETQCRIVVDVANDQLVAAQAYDGLKWIALSQAEKDDVSESLFGANDVSEDPEEWDLSPIESLPQWATDEKLQKSAGQLAYERDLAAQPNYEDGARRPGWDQLGDVAKDSWERNPTDRKLPETHQVQYVIRSLSEGDKDLDGAVGAFWSNNDGWGDLKSATRFTTKERMEGNLPVSSKGDSEWMLVEEALDLTRKLQESVSPVAAFEAKVASALEAASGLKVVFSSMLQDRSEHNAVYHAHSGQTAEIVSAGIDPEKETDWDEEALPFLKVRFADGVEVTAFGEELFSHDARFFTLYSAVLGGYAAARESEKFVGPYHLETEGTEADKQAYLNALEEAVTPVIQCFQASWTPQEFRVGNVVKLPANDLLYSVADLLEKRWEKAGSPGCAVELVLGDVENVRRGNKLDGDRSVRSVLDEASSLLEAWIADGKSASMKESAALEQARAYLSAAVEQTGKLPEGEPTKVRKTVIQFTVLHDDGQDLSSTSLRDIAYECGEGGYIGGGLAVVSNEALTRQQVDAEAAKLGSDASFFDIDPEEDGQSVSPSPGM